LVPLPEIKLSDFLPDPHRIYCIYPPPAARKTSICIEQLDRFSMGMHIYFSTSLGRKSLNLN